ncbi:hypothetical protein BH11PSE9_BH11PSE9_15260 [soil metagenome]
MNAAIRNLTHLTMIVATAAAAFVAQSAHAAGADRQVVQLERVVITGKRLPAVTNAATTVAVVELPRVVITGKRMAAEPVVVAQLPRVVITGKRLPAEATLLAAKNTVGLQAF